ncbi:MAG: DcrB-related protein [Armatimonadota bacterium]|nr:DcrB-related protein [Armatimonadota bacterium]MDR7516353.1 DcrB-related protein [Armatimonadota bacterium]MDR7560033.1 DcrB-related protein [Armatimonadota bacterium]MDR7582072.1 DcrB-related protein [Armatimonadota bacterium]MDR7588020.1 DcrB-related protein [Armatimonadota bacterium]
MTARMAAALCGLLLVASGAASAATGWATFTHPRLGFTLSYPPGWEVARTATGVVLLVVGPPPAGVSGLRMNVSVTHEEVPPGMTVEQYDSQNESGMGLLFTGYRRLRADRTRVGDYPAVVRYYTWIRGDGVELYQMQLAAIAGTRGYVVTGTTAAASRRLAEEARLLVSILLTFRPGR